MPYKVAAGRSLLASKNYQAKILDMFGSSVVAYWPQNEAGGTVSRDIGGRGLNGSYTGVTLRAQGIGDGETAASYDGSTSYNNVYSAGLASAFNNQTGTFLLAVKMSGTGVWTDGIQRTFCICRADINNRVYIAKSSGNNLLDFSYVAGGTTKLVQTSAFGGFAGWMVIALTWSKTADEVRAYGCTLGASQSQIGSTQTGLGTWVGALGSGVTAIGAATTTAPVSVTSGTIGPVLLLNRAATAGEIAAASTL